MIPLIQGISDSDAERYYQGVVVFFESNPVMFNRKEGSRAVVTKPDGDTRTVLYSNLRLKLLPPFYTANGDWSGLAVQRSPRRGVSYSIRLLEDILSLSQTGDAPRTEHRINKDWFIRQSRGVQIIHHRGAVVGFRSNKTGEYLLQDAALAERLTKLLGDANAVIRSFT